MKSNILGGTEKPTDSNRYLARDGLYYNGYCLSTDCAEDAFGECFRKISNELAKELGLYMKPCCQDAPRIRKNDQWVCSICDSVPETQYEQYDLFGYNDLPYNGIKPKECDCGGEKTYDKEANLHVDWCALRK